MATTVDRTRERATAVAIFGVALIAALWILHRPVTPPVIQIAPPPTDPIADAPAALLGPIEIVDLPADVQPRTAAPAAQPPAPAAIAKPAPSMPPPPAPAPEAPAPVTDPPPPPKTEPAPEPPKVLPLRPEPVRVQVAAAPSLPPLKPEPPREPPRKTFAPLKPAEPPTTEPTPRDPLKVTDAELDAFRAARAESKAVESLKPEPEKPPQPPPDVTPLKPEVRPAPPVQVAAAAPSQPLKPEPPAPPRPMVAREPAPPMKAAPRPSPAPPVPQAAPPQPQITTATIGEGRALLQMLEKGSGPTIQISWPSQPAERDHLYRLFVSCFGMRVGLADSAGHLYLDDGKPGEPSEFDTERYSGFVRRPEGAMAADEQHEAARLAAFHHTDAAPVRVFPRHVDAYLMSGLRQAVGDGYLALKTIRARYRLNNDQVIVDSITADGRAIPGTIDLATASRGCAE